MLHPPASRAPIPIRMPPMTAPSAVRHGTRPCQIHAPAAAEAMAAPIMMPMSVTLMTLARAEFFSAVAWVGTCQPVQDCGWAPSSPRNFDPQSPNALVMPQVPPLTSSTAAAPIPMTTEPARIGQEPRTTRAAPCAVGTASTGGGLRRFCTRRLTTTRTRSAAMVMAHDPAQPTEFDSRIGWKAGRLSTRWYCHMYSVEPMMNPPSVYTIVVCPAPTPNTGPARTEP